MKIISHEDAGYREWVSVFSRRAITSERLRDQVAVLVNEVQNRGDSALIELTKRFDKASLTPSTLRVSEEEWRESLGVVTEELKAAVRTARVNVARFAQHSLRKDWETINEQGARVGERFLPFERVGIYVPGGTAPLVSTALMTVTLAAVAGVPEIVVMTPCGADGTLNASLLYALKEAGATEVYKVGGAQAIAAMAYGTESIRAVTKIFGPGNSYVVEAKRQCFGVVAVDLLPGPSEILTLADDSAHAAWVASDLLAQAEHDPESAVGLLTDSRQLLDAVAQELEKQAETLTRNSIVKQVLETNCLLVHVANVAEGVRLVNDYAPEHLSLILREEEKWLPEIRTAGAVFMGNHSPVAAGDFLVGPSHELPTGGAGKSFSGLTVDQFQRRTSFIKLDAESMARSEPFIRTFCEIEGLDAHQRSASIRIEEENPKEKV